MKARRTLSLLAALALLAPLAAVAVPVCSPGPHCPMAAAMAGDPPCHGTAIQADSCCRTAAAATAVEIVPVASAPALAADPGTPVPRIESAAGVPPLAADAAAPRPLYRLFRALLI